MRLFHRHGLSTIEVFVALAMLSVAITVAARLGVQQQRLSLNARHYRTAVEEVTNQLGRLAAIGAAEREDELQEITPSDFAARLPHPELTANLRPAEGGEQLTVTLSWGPMNGPRQKVELFTWVPPAETSEDER